MKRLRVAVIGAGHLGRIHARLLKNNRHVRLMAVCDPQPLAQQAAIADFNVRAVSDYQKVMDEIDMAVIATPSATHAAIARRLIEAGKHLLIEKPISISSADGREIAELAASRKVRVAVGHVERFNAAVAEALRCVGTPRYLEANRFSGFTFRSTDIGVVHDLMIHDIDLAQHVFGTAVMRVSASGIAVLGNDEDIAEARLEFTCGAVANLRASRCSFQPERTLNIFGTQGFAAVDLAGHRVTVVEIPTWVQQRQLGFLDLNGQQQAFVREHLFDAVLPKRTIEVTPINAIEAEHQDWIESIESNRDPRVTADQATRNVETAEQIIESIDQHVWSRGDSRMCGAFATPGEAPSRDLIPEILAPAEDRRRVA